MEKKGETVGLEPRSLIPKPFYIMPCKCLVTCRTMFGAFPVHAKGICALFCFHWQWRDFYLHLGTTGIPFLQIVCLTFILCVTKHRLLKKGLLWPYISTYCMKGRPIVSMDVWVCCTLIPLFLVPCVNAWGYVWGMLPYPLHTWCLWFFFELSIKVPCDQLLTFVFLIS